MKVVLELVRPCKYGASYRIRAYTLPLCRASVAAAHMPVAGTRRLKLEMWAPCVSTTDTEITKINCSEQGSNLERNLATRPSYAI